jgi:hypothetical protein
MKLVFGLLVVAFSTFQLYPRIEKVYTVAYKEQHATFEERFPLIIFPADYLPDDEPRPVTYQDITGLDARRIPTGPSPR